jgi:predicted transposase YbfD/YdcC
MAEYLSADWAGCRQVFRVERERRIGTEVEVEVAYGITSLARERAGASRLLRLNRGHWGIENRLHHRRDVTLREDASRIRKGGAGQLMAALRNLILFVLARAGNQSLTAAIRHYMCHPDKALALMSSRI